MNSESYSECIVQTVRPKWVIPAVAGMVLSLGAFIYFLLCMNIWLELLSAAIFGILLFLVYRYGSVEYEYLYILDELTIAKIFRKRSRKDAVSVSMQEVEMLCPTEDSDAERMRGSGSQVEYLDFSSGEKDKPTYTLKYVSGGKTHFLCFEPDEKMLKQMRHDHPGRVRLRK